MAEKSVAILTDSIACLPGNLVTKHGIRIIPLNFYANGKLYIDGIDVTPSEAYQLFLRDKEAFKTSSASPGDFLRAYREALEQGKDILCVLLSSKLSVLYDTARIAMEQIREEYPNSLITVLDSQTAAAAKGFITLAAARTAEAGKGFLDVLKTAEEVREKVSLIAYMDTIRYVYRSGRIPKIASVAGSMLKIKPVFDFTSGVPRFLGTVRSKEIGIQRIIEGMREKVGKSPVHVAVMHVYDEEEAVRLKEIVANEFNCVELWITEFSPLMGYTCGTGTIGLAFYPVVL
jgi:DegV family protein with EDD domain